MQNFKIGKTYAHIWNQHRKCIRMSTNMPMFGLVVLEIACDIFIHMTYSSIELGSYSINCIIKNRQTLRLTRKRCSVSKNSTTHYKNRSSKHRPVCTHFDVFYMLIPNMDRVCLGNENISGYLKNHYTKHRHVCTHFDLF